MTTKKPTPERELALEAAADLARRERKTAKALLRTERGALRDLTEVVHRLTETVAAAPMLSASVVRRHLPIAQAAIGTSLLRARGSARTAGRERLLEELGREVAGRDRLFATPLTLTAAELDEVAAFVAASSLSASWGQAALSAIAADTSPMKAAKAIAPNVERTVATEVARAFNDERERLLVDMAEILGGSATPGKPDHPRPGAFKIRSEVLDSRTCDRCFAGDGEIVELHKSFTSGTPPVHPHCLPPGVPIRTPGGTRPVELLDVGDVVLGGVSGLPRRVVEVHRNPFEGHLVCVRAGCRTLRLTPNHPVLTQRGWVEAGALVLTDHLFCEVSEAGVGEANAAPGEAEHAPAHGDEFPVLRGIGRSLAHGRVPVARIDLQRVLTRGDGKVDVPRTDGELRDRVHAEPSERVEEERLDRARSLGGLGCGQPTELFPRNSGSPDRVMRGGGEALASLHPLTSHPNDVRLAASADGDSHLPEVSSQSDARDADLRGDRLQRPQLIDVETSEPFAVNGGSVAGTELRPQAAAGARNPSAQAVARDRDLGAAVTSAAPPSGLAARWMRIPADDRQASEPLVRHVDEVHVANVRPVSRRATHVDAIWREPYDGVVHNIGVDVDESYLAEGLVVHNCRGVVEHVLVHKPERLEDIAIDYDLFKQELRDVIREGRAESERHALGFAADSLGKTRSPKALTKRFADERHVKGSR